MKIVVALLAIGALIGTAEGQATSQHPSRIVTTTRLVATFSDLENELGKALQQNDQPALNRLLSEDFQVWTPAPPGQPIPREDWLRHMETQKPESFQVRQMAVRGLTDEISVASFVLTEAVAGAQGKQKHSYFVVDLWKKSGDAWQITDRYVSAVSGASPAAAKTTDKRPTGKD